MTKLILEFKKDFETAEKVFAGHKIMLAIYKTRINSLMRIIKNKLKGWKSDESDKTKLVFFEEGNNEHIERERTKLTEFLFSESEALINDPEINKIKTDRMMQRIVTKLRKAKERTKHKAITTALGADNVIGFFLKMGISVVYRIEN